MAALPELPAALQSMGQALLIGLLVGFQREAAQTGQEDILVVLHSASRAVLYSLEAG